MILISDSHWCMVWIEKSVTRVTDRHHKACCKTVISSDGFFYSPHTPMIDIFSCIPFDLPHLIFKVELAINSGNKLEGDVGDIGSLQAQMSPYRIYPKYSDTLNVRTRYFFSEKTPFLCTLYFRTRS